METINKVIATNSGYKMNVLNINKEIYTVFAPNIELLYKRAKDKRN